MKKDTKKIATLLADIVFLCQYAKIPLNDIDELCKALAFDKDLIPASTYNKVVYRRIPLNAFFALTEDEANELRQHTFIVEPGHCLLIYIKRMLDELREYAPQKRQKDVTAYKRAIVARATPEALDTDARKNDTSANPDSSAAQNPDSNIDEADYLAKRKAAEKGLPVYFDMEIDKKHVKKAIYCRCTFVIGGKRKLSKKATYISCRFKVLK